MSQPLTMLWRACSGGHDWSDGALLSRVLDRVARLGLIGPATDVKVGWDEHPVAQAFDLDRMGERLVAYAASMDPVIVDAAGDAPPWSLFFGAWRYDATAGQVDGMNALQLRFDVSGFGEPDFEALADAFFDVHTAANTEYAVLHPYEHWVEFAERAYQIPVTIGPMFQGVFWANFLGFGHIGEFDRGKLAGLRGHEVEWVDGPGLRLIAHPDPRDCATPDVEARYVELTESFRAALREDSKWHP